MERKKEILIYEIGISIFIIKIFLEMNVFFKISSLVDNCLVLLACVAIIVSYWHKRYSKKRLLFIGISTFILAFFSKRIDNYYFFISWLIICRLDKNNFQRIIKLIYKIEVILVIFIIVISIIYLTFDYKIDLLFSYRRGVKAFNFGFIHPNLFSVILVNVLNMWIWLNYNRITKKVYIYLFIINICSYYFTKTRTSFIIFNFLLFMIFIIKNYNQKFLKVVLNLLSKYLFFILGLTIALLTHLYLKNNEISLMINKILTTRIHLAAYALINYKYTILGQIINFKINWDPIFKLNSFTFDCLYSQLFFNLGIIWFIFLSFSFYKISKKLDEKSKILLIIWYLYGIAEVHGLLCFFGFQILFLGLIFKENNQNLLLYEGEK